MAVIVADGVFDRTSEIPMDIIIPVTDKEGEKCEDSDGDEYEYSDNDGYSDSDSVNSEESVKMREFQQRIRTNCAQAQFMDVNNWWQSATKFMERINPREKCAPSYNTVEEKIDDVLVELQKYMIIKYCMSVTERYA